ncbi:MAG: DUF2800 domain-containing protein [Tissierellia bacterium]|nr:DUF2800 domain-containing protein [Tissierellia bacterium]
MPEIHAKLSASASARWLNCPPSLLLNEKYPDTTSEYAKEGTLAHAVAELKATKYFLKGIGPKTFQKKMDEFKKDEFWQTEMDRFTDDYFNYLKNLATGMPEKPYVAIEKKVNYGRYAKDGFGTADCVMIQGDTIHVCDLKYGKGVPVSAEDNPQLMLYALGAYQEYGFIYPIEKAVLHIIQPRLDNYSSWEISLEDLLMFGEEVKIKSELAWNGEGEFNAGSHCKFCRAGAKCRARAEENVKLAGFTKTLPAELSNEEVGKYLLMAQDIQAWVKDLEEYALTESLAGREVKGWKAVEGRSNRKIVDEEGLAKELIYAGFDEVMIYKPRQLDTITNLEKLCGKKAFMDISAGLIDKPQGKPTLVKSSDKRPAVTNAVKAEEVFK